CVTGASYRERLAGVPGRRELEGLSMRRRDTRTILRAGAAFILGPCSLAFFSACGGHDGAFSAPTADEYTGPLSSDVRGPIIDAPLMKQPMATAPAAASGGGTGGGVTTTAGATGSVSGGVSGNSGSIGGMSTGSVRDGGAGNTGSIGDGGVPGFPS